MGEQVPHVRTRLNVRNTLEGAKLESNDVQGHLSQVISFDSNFSGTDLCLLELNPELLEEINVGTRLVFRGDVEDTAVLCTEKSTFEVKEAETSNSLLILKNLLFPSSPSKRTKGESEKPDQSTLSNSEAGIQHSTLNEDLSHIQNQGILRIAHSYFELQKTSPNLARLHKILQPSAYKGLALSSSDEGNLMTFESLLQRVPASSFEIQQYLHNLKCIELDGYIRLLSSEYVLSVFSLILNCAEEDGSIFKDSVMGELSSLHSSVVLEKLLNWFFNERKGGQSSSSGEIRDMNEFEICRFIGESIAKTSKKFFLYDFMKAWQESVPNRLKVNIKQLDGIAICDKDSTPSVIWYYPEEALPDSLEERFMVLFQTKAKWRQDEIFPYIQTFATSSQSVGNLLTKFARVHTAGDVKYYTAKHAK